MSRRLRTLLRGHWMEHGQPGAGERVLPRFHGRNYRERHFDVVLRRAGLAGHTPKDLRDTFASWLVSLGAPLPWVSKALGHSDWSITARHYAKWMEDAGAERGIGQLDEGELWPDLLARVTPSSDSEAPANVPDVARHS